MRNTFYSTRKMQSFFSVLLAVILFHVQLSFSNNIQIHFLLFVTLYFSLDDKSPVIGPFYAFIVGLCLDLITEKTLGMCAGVYAIISYLAIIFRSSFFSGDIVRRLAILSLLVAVFFFVYSWEMHLLYHGLISANIFSNMVVNILFCIFGFTVFGKLTAKSYNRSINE